jgi:hypothetical protein
MISKIEVERFTLSSAKPFVRFHRTKSRSENTKPSAQSIPHMAHSAISKRARLSSRWRLRSEISTGLASTTR